MENLLELKGVDAWYGGVQVLHEVSMAVKRGGITSLLGANGAGKTTTLRAICNVMARVAGDIQFDGAHVRGKPTQSIVRMGLSHVPDGRGTLAQLTVLENLRLGGYTLKGRQALGRQIDRMYELFPRLKERAAQQAGTLSGGEQQMLAIARALMPQPRMILLDEPSFGLAPLIVKEIFEKLRQINREESASFLIVEQNVRLALEISDDAYLMETGRIVKSGAAGSMLQDESIKRSYLGH